MHKLLLQSLAVGGAGFIGAVARFLVAITVGRLGLVFPLGTLIINLSGSMFLGWFSAYIVGRNVDDTTRLAIGVGFVGAYTTFSTFMFETSKLWDNKAYIEAAANLILSIVLGLIAVRLGAAMGGRHPTP